MKTRLLAGLAFAGAILLGGYAVSQTISLPTVQNVNPGADLIQVIPGGVPQAGNQYAPIQEVLATSGYLKVKPSNALGGTGYTNTFGNYQTYLVFILAATMPYSYVTLAPTPSDGARECVFAGGSGITLLYVNANTGQTISNAVTTLSANTGVCYTYSLSNLVWDRS